MKNIVFEKFDRGVFVVNVLGIVHDKKNKKILIGKRKNDPYTKRLNWCFPGGRPAYKKNLEFYLKKEVKKKTSINIKVEKVLFAKTRPENRKILSIYYLCEPLSRKIKAGEKFVDAKWVNPAEVLKYFKLSTSIHPFISKLLKAM